MKNGPPGEWGAIFNNPRLLEERSIRKVEAQCSFRGLRSALMNEHFFHFHMKPIWQLDFLRKKAAKSCHIVFICEKSGERPGEISKSPLKHEIFTIFSLKFFFSYFDGLATLNLQVIVFIYMTTATLGHNLKMISHHCSPPFGRNIIAAFFPATWSPWRVARVDKRWDSTILNLNKEVVEVRPL